MWDKKMDQSHVYTLCTEYRERLEAGGTTKLHAGTLSACSNCVQLPRVLLAQQVARFCAMVPVQRRKPVLTAGDTSQAYTGRADELNIKFVFSLSIKISESSFKNLHQANPKQLTAKLPYETLRFDTKKQLELFIHSKHAYLCVLKTLSSGVWWWCVRDTAQPPSVLMCMNYSLSICIKLWRWVRMNNASQGTTCRYIFNLVAIYSNPKIPLNVYISGWLLKL